jgi:hypothetical protein
MVDINGGRALILRQDDVTASVSSAYDPEGRALGIYILRNPDKLARIEKPESVA